MSRYSKQKQRMESIPPGAVKADPEKITLIDSWAQDYPRYYEDIEFECVECKDPAIWKAKHKKLYFESGKGRYGSKPTLCEVCRYKREQEKNRSRQQMKNRKK